MTAPRRGRPDVGVLRVHRIAACVVAAVIAVFGVLGVVGGLAFFDTDGAPVLGLSTNGALSTVSVVTAIVLVAAAVRGGHTASTVMIVVGVLFVLSAFVNLALIGTPLNLLAFGLTNVFFSIGAGLVLLFAGAYGRVSGKLPRDNPYRMERHPDDDEDDDGQEDPQPRPSTNAEAAADAEMAEAARAMAAGTADAEQRRRLAAMDRVRTHEDRRAIWMGRSDDRESPSGSSSLA